MGSVLHGDPDVLVLRECVNNRGPLGSGLLVLKSTGKKDGNLDRGGPLLRRSNVVQRWRPVIVQSKNLIDILRLSVELLVIGTDGVTSVDLCLRPRLAERRRLGVIDAVRNPTGSKTGVTNTTGRSRGKQVVGRAHRGDCS